MLGRRVRLKEFRSANYVPQAIARPKPLILVRAISGPGEFDRAGRRWDRK